eukprot:CAMPEP_0202923294 /NCGR_PEP_ID=MMETSP1392-20130828/78375_1 /ASSEMBLY_ACC=CAM_ASM_000868 /TAXON_ID=225041 /ORGANISM="Chlamydomonas chlamydogama, Strain SAG 11-48b" /LENGTH=67 /DNA_ID=CAMNT_0049616969 /DNA_START=278 /DNA_END=481 /DNA_ORIENTATION=-
MEAVPTRQVAAISSCAAGGSRFCAAGGSRPYAAGGSRCCTAGGSHPYVAGGRSVPMQQVAAPRALPV